MKTRLTPAQQIERFGMTFADAHALRDRALAELPAKTIADGRTAWQALAYELRGERGQPMQTKAHPEAIRFYMLRAIIDGSSVEAAKELAREFANK